MRKLLFKITFSKGFTLIELLTVIGILSVIGAIAVSVIAITLRSSKKADLLEMARQNSDTALTQMVKGIRYATSLNSPAACVPSVSTGSITVTSVSDNTKMTYSCSAGTITANGTPLFDANSLTVSACSFTCSQTSASDPPTITIQYTLSPKVSNGFAETKFTLPFQSSVTMRNL